MNETLPLAEAADSAGMRSDLSKGRLAAVIAGTMLGMLLAALDQTIVGTAMPRVIAELNGLEHYAWVFTGYMLASTVSVPIYGKLSDIYGRRIFFVGGMLIFLLGSALSGISQNMTQLILFRAVQGLGAGAMMPIAMAIIGDIFPPAERGKWQGLFTAVFGLAAIVGPAMGGWITDNWGWRWVFYVNLPVGIVAVVVAGLALPRHSRHREHSIDYAGAGALVAAAVPMLLAFSWAGTTYAWASPQIAGLLLFSVLMIAAFLLIEHRAAEPIISLDLFRNRIVAVSAIAMFLSSVGMFGAIMYLPLFIQGVVGNTATSSGAVSTPLMMGFIVSSLIGGQLLARTGRYKVLALSGYVVAALGLFLLGRMDATVTNAVVIRNMVITGLGIGVMMSLFTIVVQNAVPYERLGQVTSTITFFRSIGGTIGVAVLGSVMISSFKSNLAEQMTPALRSALGPASQSLLENPQAVLSPAARAQLAGLFAGQGRRGENLLQQFMAAARGSLAGAITDIFLFSAAVMVLGFVTVLFLREIPLRRSHGAAPGATGPGTGELEAPMGTETDLEQKPELRPRPQPMPQPERQPEPSWSPLPALAQATVAATVSPPAQRARRSTLLGLLLAAIVQDVGREDSDGGLLADLSRAADGRYPANWTAAERGRAVARDLLEPLAIGLLREEATVVVDATVPTKGDELDRLLNQLAGQLLSDLDRRQLEPA